MQKDSFLRMPIVRLIYNRYHKASTSNPATIEVRISWNRQQKYISTGIQVLPKEWHHGIVTNRQDAIQLNKFLDNLIIDVKKVVNEMVESGRIDIYAIPEGLKKLRIKEIDVFEFFEKQKKIRLYGQSAFTKGRYDRCTGFLRNWGKIKKMEDLNEETVIELDAYLKAKGMKANSRWSNYHKVLNAFISDAVNEGYLRKNPYKFVTIDKGNDRIGIGKHLTREEYESIRTADMPTECLERVRDVFIFQTNTCLSFVDLEKFNPNKIEEVKGKRIYTGKRGKTGIPFTVPLLPNAVEILEKYDWKLPLVSNQKYNKYLKEVVKTAGVDKPVSTHWARHTGATLLLNAGVSMDVVSKICGHSSIKMTEQIYAKMYDETVVDAVAELDKENSK